MAKKFISDEEMAQMEAASPAPTKSIISDAEMAKMEAEQPSELESGLRGAVQGVTMGFGDELAGGIEALWETAKGDPATFGELYKRSRDESRERNKLAETVNPNSFMAGQIGGGIATAAIPGMGGTTLGKLAIQGAAQGLGSSEAENIGDMAKDAALGAGTGAIAYGAGKGLETIAKAPALKNLTGRMTDKLDEIAETQAYKAIDPNRTQLRGVDVAADINTARNMGRKALDEGIISDGLSSWKNTLTSFLDDAPSMKAMQDSASSAMSSAHDDLANFVGQNANKTIKKSALLEGLDDLVGNMQKPLDSDAHVRNLIEGMGDSISFKDAIDLRKRLGKMVKWGNAEQSAEEQLAEKAYHGLNKMLDDVYSGYKGVRGEEAVMNKIVRGLRQPEGKSDIINKSDLITGAIGLGTGGPLGAAATMAGKKLATIHGNQAAALTANITSETLSKIAPKMGKYAKVLTEAAQRGGNSVAATDYVLSQQDPEYREMKRKAFEEE